VRALGYDEFLDKILGGWIGKCVGGTIGAQVEGAKELMNFTLETAFPAEIPPNDDLDLQVLWLEVLMEKGVHFTSNDLADAWMDRCWYPFNEYGNFRRNYSKGIKPPVSGAFDNKFFETGMGCPIRAEIWGFVAPGNPELEAKLAVMDGTLDHTEQSVGAERMWASVAADAFFDGDLLGLMRKHMHHLPPDSAIRSCVENVFDSYDKGLDWPSARERMLICHGAPEACDAPVNTGLTVLAILYSRGDFGEAQLIALNAGYDTDCTCATAGAIMGEVLGADRIPEAWKKPIGDAFVTGIDLRRRDFSLLKLAEDTAAAGVAFASSLNSEISIEGAPGELADRIAVRSPEPFVLQADYHGMPSIAWGQGKSMAVRVGNRSGKNFRGKLLLEGPKGWDLDVPTPEVEIPAGKVHEVEMATAVPKSLDRIAQTNLFTAGLADESGQIVAKETFGLSGAAPWHCLGVFFDTFDTTKSDTCPWLVDGRYRAPSNQYAWQHHFANLDRAYISESDFDYAAAIGKMKTYLGDGAILSAHEIEIPVEEAIGLRMEMCVYVLLNLISPEKRTAWLSLGVTDAYRLWLNGREVARSDSPTVWTPYNQAVQVEIREGANRVVFKLLRRTEVLRASFGVREFLRDKPFNCADWFTDFAYGIEPAFVEGG